MNTTTTSGPGSQEARATATETGREAKAAGEDLLNRARHEAEHVKDKAVHEGRSAAEHEKQAAAGEVGGMASALHATAEQLEDQHQPTLAAYVKQAADGLDHFSHSISDRGLDRMVADVENFARRQPALFLGGAVATGFVLARFLTASSQRRHYSDSDYGYGGSEHLTPSQMRRPPDDYQATHAGYPPESEFPPTPEPGTTLGQRHPPGSTPSGLYGSNPTLGQRHPPAGSPGLGTPRTPGATGTTTPPPSTTRPEPAIGGTATQPPITNKPTGGV